MREKNFKNSFKQRVLVAENNITLPCASYIESVCHGDLFYDHKAGACTRNDLPRCYQLGKDLFLQQIIVVCNKKGMHEVVYYSHAYPSIQIISELIYQLGKLKFLPDSTISAIFNVASTHLCNQAREKSRLLFE